MKKMYVIAIWYALKNSANSKIFNSTVLVQKITFAQNVLTSMSSSCLQSICLFFGSLGCSSRFAQLSSVKWYLCHSCQIFEATVWLFCHRTTYEIFCHYLATEETARLSHHFFCVTAVQCVFFQFILSHQNIVKPPALAPISPCLTS